WPPPEGQSLGSLFGLARAASGEYQHIVHAARAAREANLVLIVGPPGSGKTDAAIRAISEAFPRSRILVPKPTKFYLDNIAVIPDRHLGPKPRVLFLDDLGQFTRRFQSEADLVAGASEVASFIARTPDFVTVITVRQEDLSRLMIALGPQP